MVTVDLLDILHAWNEATDAVRAVLTESWISCLGTSPSYTLLSKAYRPCGCVADSRAETEREARK